MADKKQPQPKIKASKATRFGRAERRALNNTGREQAGLKAAKKKGW